MGWGYAGGMKENVLSKGNAGFYGDSEALLAEAKKRRDAARNLADRQRLAGEVEFYERQLDDRKKFVSDVMDAPRESDWSLAGWGLKKALTGTYERVGNIASGLLMNLTGYDVRTDMSMQRGGEFTPPLNFVPGALPDTRRYSVSKNAELVAASGYSPRGGDLGASRSYNTTGDVIRGGSASAFTGYETGSFGKSDFGFGDFKVPSQSFKMPIGKGENYEL